MEEVPNFQLFSSQNSDLDNEQLDEIEQKAQAKNTKRATEWGVKKFEKWCEKRKIRPFNLKGLIGFPASINVT